MKPKIFIGSSSNPQSIEIAEAIQANLTSYAHTDPWHQGFFNLSGLTISTLTEKLPTYDFAIFVFTPEDEIKISSNHTGINKFTVRDNVIFETGLSIGILGLKRVFIIRPENAKDIQEITDLLAVFYGTYDPTNTSVQSAVGPFCYKVKQELQSSGKRIKPAQSTGLYQELHHINLPVTNMDQSIDFYENFLQLKRLIRPDDIFKFPGAWFEIANGQQIHLVVKKDGTFNQVWELKKDGLPPDIHFAMRVDFEVIDRIKNKLELQNDPPKVPYVIQPFEGINQVYMRDPDNHLIEVTALTLLQREVKYIS